MVLVRLCICYHTVQLHELMSDIVQITVSRCNTVKLPPEARLTLYLLTVNRRLFSDLSLVRPVYFLLLV